MTRETSNVTIGAYTDAVNFLKDYIAVFCRSDFDFAPFFGIDKLLDLINIELAEVELLDEGPIGDPEVGFVFKKERVLPS